MISAGIDIGSRTVKVVALSDGQVSLVRKSENSFDSTSICLNLLQDLEYDTITATGYGRHLFAGRYSCPVISEIKAFALGARAMFPSCRTVLDIGGQDIKAIGLDESGQVRRFEMNDKCSAGTGRFIEIMAMALGYTLSEFGTMAMSATIAEKINSMCTVFAESEVVSLLARGARREEVALGIHQSVVGRARAMLNRVAIEDDVVFVGGVALNPCAVNLLGNSIQRRVWVPEDPQVVGAYGCALHGANGVR